MTQLVDKRATLHLIMQCCEGQHGAAGIRSYLQSVVFGMAYVDARAALCYGDCGDSMPSSTASEDTLDINESDISIARLQDAVGTLLRGIGEDVEREGLRDTPKVRLPVLAVRARYRCQMKIRSL